MSDIYCHEDVFNFTNPMAQFDEGHHVPMKKPYKKAPIVPTPSPELIPDEPLTRRGYPRGLPHGDQSGRVDLLS